MSTSRRDFLKFVVAGSVASGCPVDFRLIPTRAEDGPTAQVDGDHFAVCHEIRDGKDFTKPPVSKRYDTIIVGGGVSGLAAAYFLRDQNFLLLEKEPHFGGNAYLEEYQGQAFATGSAFDEEDSESCQLAKEIGLTLLPINSPDPTIINGTWVADTWGDGLNHLPYSPTVRDSFKRFKNAMLALDPEKDAQHLDSFPISDLLKNYAPEVTTWWDMYGPSNWGARAKDTSALVVVGEMHAFTGGKDPRVTLPGGNGALAHGLAKTLNAKHAERMLADCTIVSVEPQKDSVNVAYVHQGELTTASAKCVVMATPKFITGRIVSGLPEAQATAMRSFRYCPYPVINMIFDKPVYNKAYDTWCTGKAFTDIVVADWVMQKQPGYVQKNNILSFYTPLLESQRASLLEVESCQLLAEHVLRDFQKTLPEFKDAQPVEVHLYRRGHPMYVPVPYHFTRTIPLASAPMDRIFFANTDSIGPVSDISQAVVAGHRGADWAIKRQAGRLPIARPRVSVPQAGAGTRNAAGR